MHQNNHKDLILLTLLKTIRSWCEYLPFDSLSITYHFLLQILSFHCQNHFIKFTTFCVSIIYMIVAEFCEKLKVVSSNFSMMKSNAVPSSFLSFPIKLICCGSFNLVYLLKSIAINLYLFFF